jgi:hypothetical protein
MFDGWIAESRDHARCPMASFCVEAAQACSVPVCLVPLSSVLSSPALRPCVVSPAQPLCNTHIVHFSRYGAVPGLTSSSCTAACAAEYLCLPGSSSPTSVRCPPGWSSSGSASCITDEFLIATFIPDLILNETLSFGAVHDLVVVDCDADTWPDVVVVFTGGVGWYVLFHPPPPPHPCHCLWTHLSAVRCCRQCCTVHCSSGCAGSSVSPLPPGSISLYSNCPILYSTPSQLLT